MPGVAASLVATLPRQTKPVTRFVAERVGERSAVRIDAPESYGNLAFDLPLDQVPFGERTLLRLFRANAGENLPAATLCWVSGRVEARGALLDSPFTRRVRTIVLRNAADLRFEP